MKKIKLLWMAMLTLMLPALQSCDDNDGYSLGDIAVDWATVRVVGGDTYSLNADIQGVSLLPLLKGEQPKDWRNALYYHFYEYPAEHMVKRHYGIRTERYKLIHFYNDINWWELYDMQADPTEMHNLYGQKEYEPVVKELKEQMLKLQEQYNDPVRFSPERDKE